MSMFKFEINPCRACTKRYDLTDINNISNCCVETAGAFAGQSSLNGLVGSDAYKNCEKCLSASKRALGKSECDLRLPLAPIFNQVPHYFPDYLYKLGNKDEALVECQKSCQGSYYPQQCRNNCETDYDAVIGPASWINNKKENYEYVSTTSNNDDSGDKNNNQWFYILLLIFLITGVVSVCCLYLRK